MANDTKQLRCQHAFAGTYGHECGLPATSVLITKRPEDVRQALLGMGVTPSADGLSRAGRCETHRGLRECGEGAFVRTEEVR